MLKYVFPVILTPEENGMYSANFPDLESCYTQGDNLIDAIEMADDILTMTLDNLLKEGKRIPAPTDTTSIKLWEDQIIALRVVYI